MWSIIKKAQFCCRKLFPNSKTQIKKRLRPVMVALVILHTCNLSLRRLRQKDCYRIKERGKLLTLQTRKQEKEKLGSHNALGRHRPSDLNTSH